MVYGGDPEVNTPFQPIAGAKVVAVPALSDWPEKTSLPSGANKDSDSPGQVSATLFNRFVTETDEKGEYSFSSLSPGSYRVTAFADGYESSGELVELTSGVNTEFDFYLNVIPTGPGIVLGTVYSSADDTASSIPIEGATVTLVAEDATGVSLVLFETRTNAEGYFEFSPVPEGSYELQVTKEGYRGEQLDVEVEPSETVNLSIELFLDETGETGALEGHVWEEADANVGQTPVPVAGALVCAIPVSFSLPVSSIFKNLIEVEGEDDSLQCTPLMTQTDTEGCYRFDSVPAGSVAVVVLADGYAVGMDTTQTTAGETTVLDFYLKPVGGGDEHASLSGVVTGHSDDPTFAPVYVEGAQVTLTQQSSDDATTTQNHHNCKWTTYTDESGAYEFPSLSAGTYLMKVSADEYEDSELKVKIPPPPPPPPPEGTAVRQDVELMPEEEGDTARLFGYVTESGSGSVAGPVADATVRLIPDDMAIIAIFPPPNVGYDRVTDAHGYYLFESLPAKGYQVVVLKDGYTPAQGHVDLEEGEEKQRDFILMPLPQGSATLSGFITEDVGLLTVWIPISGASVMLTPVNTLQPSMTTTSGEEGDYKFEDVTPGDYTVMVTAEGYEGEETTLHLPQGGNVVKNFALEPVSAQENASLFGKVQEVGGQLGGDIPSGGHHYGGFEECVGGIGPARR